MSTENPVSGWVGRHLRVLILVLGGMMFAAFVAIALLDQLGCGVSGECGALTRLDRARDAESFEYAVWRASSHPLGDTPFLKPGQPAAAVVSITPLRLILFIDSLVLVPGYAGLLLIYVVVLHRLAYPSRPEHVHTDRMTMREWSLQVACLVPVSAAAIDIAENGMTMRAAEDALDRLLADPTVADVHLASTLKWLFIGLALLVVAVLALNASGRGDLAALRNWLRACGGSALVAGVSLAYRAFNQDPTVNLLSAVLFAISLAAVGAALWRVTTLHDPALVEVRMAPLRGNS